jgi:integrase
MPYVFKRAGSPFYYARFQLNGHDEVISTKCKKRSDAETKLAEYVAKAKGKLTIDQQLETLLALINELPKADQIKQRHSAARAILAGLERKIELSKSWAAWREHPGREFEAKESTLKGYEAIWNRFEEWAKKKGLGFLHELSPELAEEYAANLWSSNVSPSTYNQHTKFLRALFTVLQSRAGLISNPWSGLKSKQKRRDEGRRNLSEDELKLILERAEGNMRLMFAIGLFTGLRLGDVVNLRWEDVDYKRGFVRCVPIKTERFAKVLEIPLHPVLVGMLRQHQESNDGNYVFPKERKAHAENAGSLTLPIKRFFESCGIQTTEEPEHGRRRRAIVRVGFHSLRHSFVSMCAKARTPQHVVQQLVGHGSPAMTEHYTHLDAETKLAAITALPDLSVSGVNGEGSK